MMVQVWNTWQVTYEFACAYKRKRRPLTAAVWLEEFYDKSQPRDKQGRWSRTGYSAIRHALGKLGHSKYLDMLPPQNDSEEIFAYQSRACSILPPEVKHALIARIRETPDQVDYVRDGMNKFLRDRGLPIPDVDWKNEVSDLSKADRIVEAIRSTPRDENNPQYKAAYDDFKRQSQEMWDYMTRPESEGGMGIKVSVWDERTTGRDDPYRSAKEQQQDMLNNRHIWINRGEFFVGENASSATGTNHPWMSGAEYFRFRAVHDVFGHVAVGSGFDRHGEYIAWMAHNAMYTGEGRKAMSTEYHGVNTHLWATGTPMPQEHWGIILPDSVIANVYDAHGNVIRK